MQFLLISMGVIMIVHVFFRYLLNSPLIFTEELISICFIWMCMLGSGYCIHHKLNTRIDVFVNLLPSLVQKIISVFSDLFCMSIFIYLLPTAIRFTRTQATVITPALQLPMSVIYSAFLAASFLIILRTPFNIYETISGTRILKEADE
jgi:TRAP-type C4-dicarboxylate transport system permease small subunit